MPAWPMTMSPGDSAPKRALIIKLRHIGDALLGTAVASALKTISPECHVTYLLTTGTEELVALCPDVDAVLTRKDGSARRRVWPLPGGCCARGVPTGRSTWHWIWAAAGIGRRSGVGQHVASGPSVLPRPDTSGVGSLTVW
jgi:hypothetical protein